MPNGDTVAPGATFLSIRSFYRSDPDFPKVQAYLNGGAVPSFTYHRFWAQADLAMAFAVYSELFAGGGGTGDTTPPTVPAGLAVTGTTASTVSLSWTASTDDTGVTGYQILRGGTAVGTSTTTTFTDTGLASGTQYTYTVRAQDAAGNMSAASNSATGTTRTGGGTGSVTATYHVDNDWGAGFVATVTVTNGGTAAIHSWRVTWAWSGNQRITNAWNTVLNQAGTAVTADNAGYNGTVAPGTSVTFGFQATYSGTNTAPTLTASGS
jgi:chitodextrinase